MREHFKKQIEYYPIITEDVLERVEFRNVWSGKRIGVGDRVVYALVFEPNTDDLKLINFLERELDELPQEFIMINDMSDENGIPIMAFKSDNRRHK